MNKIYLDETVVRNVGDLYKSTYHIRHHPLEGFIFNANAIAFNRLHDLSRSIIKYGKGYLQTNTEDISIDSRDFARIMANNLSNVGREIDELHHTIRTLKASFKEATGVTHDEYIRAKKILGTK